MPRVAKNPLKQIYIKKIENWLPSLEDYLDDVEFFKINFLKLLNIEIKNLKQCSQKNIVESYIHFATIMIKNHELEMNNGWFDLLQIKARERIADIYTKNVINGDNIIDIYFNDVKREYIRHPMSQSDTLEFNEKNREIFLKNNLKLVVDCAKRYINLGLPFEDLIQAGNYGLCKAFEKFDKDRGNLKNTIINSINENTKEIFTKEEAKEIISKNFTYDKNLDKTINKLPKEGFLSKNDFIAWVHKNVKNAVFASVAFQWIRAMILYELSTNGKIIHIPNSAKNSKEKNTNIEIISLDSINPRTNDCYHDDIISEVVTTNEEFVIEDENIDKIERQSHLGNIIDKLLYNLSNQERNIIKQRFGIGIPYALSPSEIAENEGISVSKVKYHINNILNNIQKNLSDDERQAIIEILS